MTAPPGITQNYSDPTRQDEATRDLSAEVKELQAEIDALWRENEKLKRFKKDPGENEDCAKDHSELDVIYASAPIGLCLLGTDTQYLRVNQRFAELNGLSVDEHIGKRVRELVPDLADVAEHLIRKVVETGEPVLDIEIQGETPAQPGVTRCWKESWWPLKDDQGRVVAINIMAEEVTERKRAEEALLESERKFSVLFEKAPNAIALARRSDGVFVDVNEQFTKIFGYARQEALGKTSAELGINPDTKDRTRILTEVQEQQSIHGLEISLFTKSGEERIFSDNLDTIVIGGDQYLLSGEAEQCVLQQWHPANSGVFDRAGSSHGCGTVCQHGSSRRSARSDRLPVKGSICRRQ